MNRINRISSALIPKPGVGRIISFFQDFSDRAFDG
jgi:hypothetical protein